MYFKSIFQGRLQFSNRKSFDKVIRMYEHRVENYYKKDAIFDLEDVFHEEDMSLVIPRTVCNITEKSWKNTVNLLEYVSQFAVSGNIGVWMLDAGKVLRYSWIVPKSDKAVVQEYARGISLINSPGKEKEAEKALSKAIDLYDKHSQAYERRGFVNYQLQKWHDAERDFGKAIALDAENSLAYYGRARIKVRKGKTTEALTDLELAIKTSLALQDIHWSARRLKAECHIQMKQFDKAEFELRFFTRRKFPSDSINQKYKRKAFFDYGIVLLELNKPKEALDALNQAIEMDKGEDNISEAEKLVYRGIARKNSGKNGYIADWNKASKLGSNRAAELLNSVK